MSAAAADAIALVRAYRDRGDLAARARLVDQYMPLVRLLAHRHRDRGERLEDLIQVGSIGLIKAIDRFRPERGSELGAFALPTIAGEIKRHLRDNIWPVTVPRAMRESRPIADFIAELGTDAGESAGERGVIVAAERTREMSEDRALVAFAARALDEQERRILHLRFFCDLSQAEIADAIGISQAKVSRVLRRALAKMRSRIGDVTGGPNRALTYGDMRSSVAAVAHATDGGMR
ncbi:MAG TPA: sigma-70 family RNA polymerase sigma factor [Gaiellaceae bacterium]|nr:sigma-70 family RNA polymerase sigma factor [Gaiellaceae bacterium]